MVFNNVDREYMILLVLHGSPSYGFVEVEANGVVDFYKPRVTTGDHHHLLSVRRDRGEGGGGARGSITIIFFGKVKQRLFFQQSKKKNSIT